MGQIKKIIKAFFRRKDCIFWILCVTVLPYAIISSFSTKKEMRDNSVLLKAEVERVYLRKARKSILGQWTVSFKYEYDGQIYTKINDITIEQSKTIRVGDTIDVLVSKSNPKRHAFWVEAKGYWVLP
ncbi:MAG: hypothetical protein IJK74_05160 [Bacteroidales bacterium]|nr:hypothetical protein [Bacteroidales bacterium]